MAQAVSCRPHTAEARVRAQVVAVGQVFLRVIRVFPVSIIPPGLHTPSGG
jgi:hypothetical protein